MASGKHFINDIGDPVVRALRSVARQNSSLKIIASEKVIFSLQSSPKVLLLSGGGAGHEPSHAGYVGDGMLDICVSGEIFASPSASQIVAGLRALPSPKGILVIVKNYTGDKLNFGLAAQRATALGIRTSTVFVADDVSVDGNELVGQRGLAGVVFVHKIAGTAAKAGASLEETTRVAQKVADSLITVGVCLDRCDIPRRGFKESLPAGELEFGMGIHNEPGVERAAIRPLSETVAKVIRFLDPMRRLPNQLRMVAMINNLGGLSVLELNVVADEVLHQLETQGLQIHRLLVGTFVTCLNGPGFSVTLLSIDDELEELLNTDTTLVSWPNVCAVPDLEEIVDKDCHLNDNNSLMSNEVAKLPIGINVIKCVLNSIVESVLKDEPAITRYDTIVGDGDCGETLLRGVRAVSNSIQLSPGLPSISLKQLFHNIASTIEKSMGGTSGAIYAIFFNATSNSILELEDQRNSLGLLSPIIAAALSKGLDELFRYTAARKGHRTLMDALIPFVQTFASTLNFTMALEEAIKGCESTRALDAVMGRASYVGKDAFNIQGGVPDPGALGVVSVLSGIKEALHNCYTDA